jgi:hypothetical protein
LILRLHFKETLYLHAAIEALGVQRIVGKIIEKAYKYNIPDPKELFQMLQERFSKETLPDSW